MNKLGIFVFGIIWGQSMMLVLMLYLFRNKEDKRGN